MGALPSGTVTFLFTDIEGSTRLIQRLGAAHREVFETHAGLLRQAMARAGGVEVAERGDGFFFVFRGAAEAVMAAAAAQRALAAHHWPPEGQVRVRMGLHTGEGMLGGDNYMGLDVNRAARIGAAGHGGQVLLSQTTGALVRDSLPADLCLRELGRHRLKDLPLPEPLFQLVADGLPLEFPPPRTLGSGPVRLPRQLTSFVGREGELRRILQALSGTRLLTLLGPGGTGKTRLSLQAAAEAAPGFPDGVFFVPLGSISDPVLVAPTVLSALELPPAAGDPASALKEHLKARRTLLVLDNFEQILTAGAQVAEWLRETPELKVLVTSRAPLGVYGERQYPVPPLELPRFSPASSLEELAKSESVALFVARAAAARPDFSLTQENAAAVAQITERLDGLPLAIELAAARVKLFPPQAIRERLSSRLAFLTGGARDLPVRQQTLRGAIGWSYELLEEPVRRLLRRLAVFVGGAALPQLEAVCGPAEELGVEPLDGLAVLVDHSLVSQGHSAGEPRFSMLETIREFALQMLSASGERERIEQRHAAVFQALAAAAGPHLTRRGRCGWLDRLEENLDNLRAALSRAIAAGQAGAAQRMVGALWRFWQMRGHLREGRERAAEALRLSGGEPADRIQALWAEGGLAYWQMDMPTLTAAYREALDLARGLADRRTLAAALYNAGFPLGMGSDPQGARRLFAESLAIARELGDVALIGEVLWGIGTVDWFQGERLGSETVFDEALETLAGTDAVFTIGWAHRQRGIIRMERRDLAGARADLERAMSIFAGDRDVSGLVLLLRDFAEMALKQGELERALRLAGAAAAIQVVSETAMLEFAQNRISGLTEGIAGLEATKTETGRPRAEELLAEGRAMPMEQAIAYALELPPGRPPG
jgi:predicted ATPase/class 3 adenylate cyclase